MHGSISIWISLFITECLCTSRKTEFVLLTNRMTWNQAHKTCDEMGMFLAVINTPLKQMYTEQYMTSDWSTLINGNLWFGLHEIDEVSPGVVKWSDCTNISSSWSSFSTDEPLPYLDNKFCFALNSAALPATWSSRDCTNELQAICERHIGSCSFDSYDGFGCGHSLRTSLETDWQNCTDICLTAELDTGEECWGVGYYSGYSGDDCWIFYSADDPDICITTMYAANPITTGVKRCFQSDTFQSNTSVTETSIYPNTTCFKANVSSTTMSVPITTVTTASSPSVNTTIENSSPTEATTQLHSTTDGSSWNIIACNCNCNTFNTSLLNLEEKIQELKAALTVDKKSTAIYRRKLISAPDDRASSSSIGYVAVIILICTFGFIIFLDFPVLISHIKKLCILAGSR